MNAQLRDSSSRKARKTIEKSHLTLVAPTTVYGTVDKAGPPKRRRNADVRSLLLLGLRDLVGSMLFVAAWTGRGVTWRGTRYDVAHDGTLHRRPAWPRQESGSPIAPMS